MLHPLLFLLWLLYFWAALWQPLLCLDRLPHVDSAFNYLWVHETHGNNRSPQIDKWNKKYRNIGGPWCSVFVSEMLELANTSTPEVRSALARHFWTKSEAKYKHTTGEVIRGEFIVSAGTLVIWARGNSINGHIGIASEDWEGIKGRVIEGNTSSEKGVQWEGDTVSEKNRMIQPYAYFKIMGFVEVTYENLSALLDIISFYKCNLKYK